MVHTVLMALTGNQRTYQNLPIGVLLRMVILNLWRFPLTPTHLFIVVMVLVGIMPFSQEVILQVLSFTAIISLLYVPEVVTNSPIVQMGLVGSDIKSLFLLAGPL